MLANKPTTPSRPPARAGASARRATLAVVLVLVLLAFSLLALALHRTIHTHLQALAVLDQVSGQAPSRTLQHLVAEPVQLDDILIPTTADRPIRARLYTPVRHPDGPVFLVFHGVHHLGIDEPRLIAFARALSSCGLRVITPELPDIRDYRIDPTSVRTIGEATRWAAQQAGSPVGVMGLSFSGGLALVAASDPVYRPSFRFVLAVGSQNSMSRVAVFYRTGQDPRPNGTVEFLPAHEYGPLVLEYEHLEDFLPPHDLRPVRRALRAHLYEDKPAELAATSSLTPPQQGEYTKLLATGSTETRHLIELSSARHAAEMAALSPHGRLQSFTVPVFLLHGAADNIIPSAESLWMAQELPAADLRAVLVSPVLSHLDLDGPGPGILDRFRLLHFFARVLQTAEQPPTAQQDSPH